jgi:hypothetical protein
MHGDIQTIHFPSPAKDGATLATIWKCRFRMFLARTANRVGIPGFIQPKILDDPVTGQHIEIRLGLLFTVVSVDGRDYYFRRFSGKYDGTGSGCLGGCCYFGQDTANKNKRS